MTSITQALINVKTEVLDADPERELLVLIHGSGSNEHGLFEMVPAMPRRYAFALPRGIVAKGPAFEWFDPELDAAEAKNQAAESIETWLGSERFPHPNRPISLLGFSQGAGVVLELLKRNTGKFRKAVLMSYAEDPGAYTEADAISADESGNRPEVFWGYDPNDNAFSASIFEGFHGWLSANTNLMRIEYAGIGHGFDEQEKEDIADFLRS
ncbi:MAG: hypothetical protein WBA28_02200 [Microbacteriaceae bacterium]